MSKPSGTHASLTTRIGALVALCATICGLAVRAFALARSVVDAPDVVLLASTAFVTLSLVSTLVRKSVVLVRDGEVVHVERLGRYSCTLAPGLNVVMPFLEVFKEYVWTRSVETVPGGSVVHEQRRDFRVPMVETAFDVPPLRVVTRDKVQLTVNAVVFYRIVDAHRAVYAVDDLWNAMGVFIGTSVRQAVASMTYEQARSERQAIVDKIVADFQERAERWGVALLEVDVQSIDAPAAVQRSEEAIVVAQRESEANIERHRAVRASELVKKETEKQVQIIEAQISAERAKVQAQSEADALRIRVEAECEAKERRIATEAQRVRELLEAGADQSFLRAVVHAESWNNLVTSGKLNKTLIVPYDAGKFLGTAQLLPAAREMGQDDYEQVQ